MTRWLDTNYATFFHPPCNVLLMIIYLFQVFIQMINLPESNYQIEDVHIAYEFKLEKALYNTRSINSRKYTSHR